MKARSYQGNQFCFTGVGYHCWLCPCTRGEIPRDDYNTWLITIKRQSENVLSILEMHSACEPFLSYEDSSCIQQYTIRHLLIMSVDEFLAHWVSYVTQVIEIMRIARLATSLVSSLWKTNDITKSLSSSLKSTYVNTNVQSISYGCLDAVAIQSAALQMVVN